MTDWNDVKAWAAGSTRANGSCEGFANNDFTARFGSFRYGYGSANAALAASKAAGTFHAGAEPPADRVVWVFYAFPTYGHVMLAFGQEALGDTSQATAFLNAKRTVGTLPVHHYSHSYLGYADTNGVNTIPEIPTPNVNPYGAAGVQMGSVNVNRRATPSTSAAVLDERSPGAWIDCAGYTDEGQPVNGNTRWFEDVIGGWYSATLCSPSDEGPLPRLNPDGTPWPLVVVTPPTPPTAPAAIEHTVTFDWNDDDTSTTNVTEKVVDGQPIAAPSIATRSAFTFARWTTDQAGAEPFDLATPITADVTLYAAWTSVPVEPEKGSAEPTTATPGETSPAAGNPSTVTPWWLSLFQGIWAALFPKKN